MQKTALRSMFDTVIFAVLDICVVRLRAVEIFVLLDGGREWEEVSLVRFL